jgi:hypothetical protein
MGATDFTTWISHMPAGDLAVVFGWIGMYFAATSTWSGFQVRRRADVPGRLGIALLSLILISAPSVYLNLGQPSVLGAAVAVALIFWFVQRNRKITKQVEQLGFEPDPD